jgi:hypothetical protein
MSVFVVFVAISSCASTRGTEPVGHMSTVELAREGIALAEARHRWDTTPLGSYQLTLSRNACECLPEWTRPMRLSVRRGTSPNVEVVEAVVDAATGDSVSSARLHYALGVTSLSDLVEQAINRGAAEVRARYDSRLGYPTRIRIDPDAGVPDDEITLMVHLDN